MKYLLIIALLLSSCAQEPEHVDELFQKAQNSLNRAFEVARKADNLIFELCSDSHNSGICVKYLGDMFEPEAIDVGIGGKGIANSETITLKEAIEDVTVIMPDEWETWKPGTYRCKEWVEDPKAWDK